MSSRHFRSHVQKRSAAAAGFIAAHRQALPNNPGISSWNLNYNHAFTNPPDDAGFIKALVGAVELGLLADSHKVFVTGYSLAALRDQPGEGGVREPGGGDRAGVGRTVDEHGRAAAGCGRADSVLLMNGSADASVPYCGYDDAVSGSARGRHLQLPADAEPVYADGCGAGFGREGHHDFVEDRDGMLIVGGGAAVRADWGAPTSGTE